MASKAAVKTGFPSIWIHGKSIRVDFMYKGTRHRHTLGLTPTKNNIKHAVGLRSTALFALKTGNYDGELLALAVEDVTVWLNRHESRHDHIRVLLSPKTQARREDVNDYFVPSAWNSKWSNLVRRAEIRPRPPYQTRHTFACWNLTARGNLAFIANQMRHSDYSMLVTVYGRWIDTESPKELERIWESMKNMEKIVPNLSQRNNIKHISDCSI